MVVSETISEIKIAKESTKANSLNRRPTTPPMSKIGKKTAMSEKKKKKKQMDIKGETKTIYGNDENKLKLIIINELPTSDKAAYSYMQPEYVEIKSVIDDINKMIVGVHVYYMDGSEDSDYYRVESISKSDISRIQIYRL